MNDTPIAFLGLGLMGSGMAGTLLEKGFPVNIYNRNPDKAKPLAERGATVAKTAAEAAAGAGAIVSMVADDKASRALWLGPDGALAAGRAGNRVHRVQHGDGRVDQGACGCGGAARLRVRRRTGDRQQDPGGYGEN